MDNDRGEIVRPERAVLAPRIPVGSKHEVVDDQLTSALEQVRQRLFSIWTVKDIILVQLHPRQLLPLMTQSIAQFGELLLFRQQRLASRQPLFPRYDFVSRHDLLSFSRPGGASLQLFLDSLEDRFFTQRVQVWRDEGVAGREVASGTIGPRVTGRTLHHPFPLHPETRQT